MPDVSHGPNVFLIVVDSLRKDVAEQEFSRDGSLEADTQILCLDNAFTASGHSAFSMAGLFTATLPLSIRSIPKIPQSVTTLPEYLSEVGYQTFGYQANPYLTVNNGYHRGFDTYREYITEPVFKEEIIKDIRKERLAGTKKSDIIKKYKPLLQGQYDHRIGWYNSYIDAAKGEIDTSKIEERRSVLEEELELLKTEFEEYLSINGLDIDSPKIDLNYRSFLNKLCSVEAIGKHLPKYLSSEYGANKRRRTASAAEIISDVISTDPISRDGSSFCYIHLMDVHSPYIPGSDDWTEDYDNFLEERYSPIHIDNQYDWALKDLYKSCVDYTKGQVERLIKYIENSNEKTYLIITADHGEALFERGSRGHSSFLTEEVISIPLIMYQINTSSDDRSLRGYFGHLENELMSNIDFLPTIFNGIVPGLDISNHDGRNVLENPRKFTISETLVPNSDATETSMDLEENLVKMAVRTNSARAVIEETEAGDIAIKEEETLRRGRRIDKEGIKTIAGKRISRIRDSNSREKHDGLPMILRDKLSDLGYI